jgi:hypothetical protein
MDYKPDASQAIAWTQAAAGNDQRNGCAMPRAKWQRWIGLNCRANAARKA